MKTHNINLVAPIKSLIIFFFGQVGVSKAQTSYGHMILVLGELIVSFLIIIICSPILIIIFITELIKEFIRNDRPKKIINNLISIYHLRKKAQHILDQNQAINAIADGHEIFRYLTQFHSDLIVVKAAIRSRAEYIQYASKDLQDNEKVIKMMLNQRKQLYINDSFKYASSRLRNNKNIAYDGLRYNILNLKYIKTATKKDRKFLINVFKFNRGRFSGFTLSLIPKKLRSDKDLLVLIINKMPQIIFDKNFALLDKSNLSLIEHATNIDDKIYKLLPPQLRAKRSILMAAILCKSSCFIWSQVSLINKAPAILRADLGIAEASLTKDASAFELFSDSVRGNKAICRLVLEKDINSYKNFPTQTLRDPEIIDYIYKIGFLNRIKGHPLLNAKGIKLLLQNGKDPEKIYARSATRQRRYKCLYVKALNAKPELITLEKDIHYLLKIDFTKLNLNARKMCYQQFKKLYPKSKKSQALDILQVANKYKDIAKTMLLQKNNMVDTGL